jgi:U3 small nucleolar RNA-associated protein 21
MSLSFTGVYLELTFPKDQFSVSCVVHPATYLNKVILGSSQGSFQLWNLRTGRLVHPFDGWGSPINVIKQVNEHF